MQGDNYQIDQEPLLKLPIRIPNNEDMELVKSLVEEVVQRQKVGQDSRDVESEIDKLIYRIYALESGDIDVIDREIKW